MERSYEPPVGIDCQWPIYAIGNPPLDTFNRFSNLIDCEFYSAYWNLGILHAAASAPLGYG